MSRHTASKQIINIKKTKDDIVILSFPYNKKLIEEIKTIKGRKYIPDLKAWSIPYYKNYREYIREKFAENYQLKFVDTEEEISSITTNKTDSSKKARIDFLNKLKVKRYSENTLRNYTRHFDDFCNYFKNTGTCTCANPENLTDEDVHEYLNYIVIKKEVHHLIRKWLSTR